MRDARPRGGYLRRRSPSPLNAKRPPETVINVEGSGTLEASKVPFPAESPIEFTTPSIWKGYAPVNNVGAEFGPLYSCVKGGPVPNPFGKTPCPHGWGPSR